MGSSHSVEDVRVSRRKFEAAEAVCRMTVTVAEMRQQIIANAPDLFPLAVQQHLNTRQIPSAKPEDIFSITTCAQLSPNQNPDGSRDWWTSALLMYGHVMARKVLLQTPCHRDVHEAMGMLLQCTEILMVERLKEKIMVRKGAVPGRTGAVVDWGMVR